MFIENFIASHDPEALEQELAKRKVARLYAFGSSLQEDTPNDIDLLIEMEEADPIKRGENLINLWDFLENYFDKKVDLLTNTALKNPVLRENIESTKKLIYAEGQQQVSA